MEVIDLAGRKGLVVGVANADSLAWSAARHFRNAGAELAMTYYNEKARSFVAPLAEEVQAQLLPCNVLQDGQLEAGLRRAARTLGEARLRLPLDRIGAQGRPAGPPH